MQHSFLLRQSDDRSKRRPMSAPRDMNDDTDDESVELSVVMPCLDEQKMLAV